MTKRTTHLWLLGALAFAVGTPALLGLLNSGSRFYLLQPWLFLIQAVPYLVAAALWLPWRSTDAARTTGILARALFFAAAFFYATMLTGIYPVGGDMIGLGFLVIAVATIVLVVAGTVVAFAVMWVRRRRAAVRV